MFRVHNKKEEEEDVVADEDDDDDGAKMGRETRTAQLWIKMVGAAAAGVGGTHFNDS